MRRALTSAAVLSVAFLASTVVAADAGGHGGGHVGGGAPMVRPAGMGHPGFHQGFGGGMQGGYHALPPVAGTLHPGPHGLYGDRGFGPVHYGTGALAGNRGRYGYHVAGAGYGHVGGPAIYDVGRGHHGFGRRFYGGGGGVDYGYGAGGYGYGYGDAGAGYGTGSAAPADVGYNTAPDYAEGTPTYAGQGYAPVAGTGIGYGPVTYQQTVGYGAGYGGASIISIPSGYNVGYAHNCRCGGGGLLQSF